MPNTTFIMFAGYNSWANTRLYDAAARMTDAAYRHDGGAFFGSVHRTLNHLLVTDRIWLKRFGARADAPDALDAVLFDDLAGLRAARRIEDAGLLAWVGALSGDDLQSPVRYRRATSPDLVVQPLVHALSHLFNHQTHHRGQIHCLMTMLCGRDFAPTLDLVAYQRATGIEMG